MDWLKVVDELNYQAKIRLEEVYGNHMRLGGKPLSENEVVTLRSEASILTALSRCLVKGLDHEDRNRK